MKSLAALAVLAIAVGCGSTPEPSIPAAGNVFQVELSQQHFGTISAFIHDEAGIVVAASKAIAPPPVAGRGDETAVVDPAMSRMLVSWLGGACRFGPTVTLIGDASQLVVVIQPEAGEGLPAGIGCGDIGLLFAIDLTLATPVEQQAVTVRVIR